MAAKIDIYENHYVQLPGFGGLFYHIFIRPDGTHDTVSGNIPARDCGYFVWPLLAVFQALTNYDGVDVGVARQLASRYKRLFDAIASNILALFHDDEDGGLWMQVEIQNLTAPPSSNNSKPVLSEGHVALPFEDEMIAMFAYLYANWSEVGGDTARMAMWSYLTDNMMKVNYSIDGQNIEVEMGITFAARERAKYLFLPYLDVPIDEQIFIHGEIARTHHSARYRIPGLFTTMWKYTSNYADWPLVIMGIEVNHSSQCEDV